MIKKNYIIIYYILLGLLTVFYTYYFMPIVDDELYNYGFSYSIANGFVPYKDFNMIVTPLFSYIFAFILKITTYKLIVYHIVLAIMITLIVSISYKIIGKSSFLIYILMLVYPYTGYNILAILFLFTLFYLNEKKLKCLSLIEPIIISLMILNKQTLILLAIPSLLFSKNKKKTLAIYLLFMFLFIIYLIINGIFYNFFDYCLFGMFDFAKENSTNFNLLFVVEIIIVLMLLCFGFKTKRKDIFYVLAFQILAFPIVNYIHFMISFIPCIYLFLKTFKNNSYVVYLSAVTFIAFFLTFNSIYWLKDNNYKILSHYPKDNFLEDRMMYMYIGNFIDNVEDILERYPEHRLYTFGSFSYLIKLSLEIPINKYDLINNGNMGYGGASKYIREIDNYCNKEKCIFIINDEEKAGKENLQTNTDILDYVKENYNKTYSSNVFSVYIN